MRLGYDKLFKECSEVRKEKGNNACFWYDKATPNRYTHLYKKRCAL